MAVEDLDDLLNDCAFGTASAEARARVMADDAAAMQLAELEAALGVISMGLSAPPRSWSRLQASLSGAHRFEHLVSRVAALFDLTEAQARSLLGRIDDDAAWLEGPAEGVLLMPVEAGPRREGLVTTLLKLAPGAQFPLHTHGAHEEVLVLEGGYRDDQSGLEMWRGRLDERDEGTTHSFTALEGLACICASVTGLAEAS